MNTIVLIATISAIVLSTASLLMLYFLMGKPRTDKYNGSTLLSYLLQGAMIWLMAGRIFGWW